MTRIDYPELDETLCTQTLPNGLTVCVVPRKGFTKSLAYFVTDYGSVHTEYSLHGRKFRLQPVLPTIWSTKCLICPETGTFPRNLRPWAP